MTPASRIVVISDRPSTQLKTIGDRTFPVAAAPVWNVDITPAPSLQRHSAGTATVVETATEEMRLQAPAEDR